MKRRLIPVVAALVLLAGAVAAQNRALSPAEPGPRIATIGYGIDEYAKGGGK
jgi:hypothetical protein